MSGKGTLFGWATLQNNRKDSDIYCQVLSEKGHSQLQRLSDSINSDAIEYCPFISRDEEIIVFGRMGIGDLDGLYISTKNEYGEWRKARRLHGFINAGRAERFPSLSLDNRILYFNRQDQVYTPFSHEKTDYPGVLRKLVEEPSNGNIYQVHLTPLIEETSNENTEK